VTCSGVVVRELRIRHTPSWNAPASTAAAARLHAITDGLASNNDVVIERGDLRFVAYVQHQVASNSVVSMHGFGWPWANLPDRGCMKRIRG
jgi:hypothetical protein